MFKLTWFGIALWLVVSGTGAVLVQTFSVLGAGGFRVSRVWGFSFRV